MKLYYRNSRGQAGPLAESVQVDESQADRATMMGRALYHDRDCTRPWRVIVRDYSPDPVTPMERAAAAPRAAIRSVVPKLRSSARRHEQLLALLARRAECSTMEIREALGGLNSRQASTLLGEAVNHRLVERVSHGHYRITDLGRRAAAAVAAA